MITIYMVAFNEEAVLQFCIDHYKSRFPNCNIIIRDNQSTDNTVEIAKKNNCQIIPYNTNGLLNDEELKNTKNSCWKNANTDWVLVIDPDELVDINAQDLLMEEQKGSTIISFEGYNMIAEVDKKDIDFANIKYGFREPMYDKRCLFNKKFIVDINFNHGSHKVFPNGLVKMSEKVYKFYHYKYISLQYIIDRYKLTASRFSQMNLKMGWGSYNLQSEEQITKEWKENYKKAVKLL